MTPVQAELLDLIRCAVSGTGLPERFAVHDPQGVYALAKSHEMGHFVGYYIDRGALALADEEAQKAFRMAYLRAARRVMILDKAIGDIGDALESAAVDYMPLKGAVLRDLYPARWMRMSGDIDLLVKPEDLQRAEAALEAQLNYRTDGHGPRHDHVAAPAGYYMDLHHTLTEREGPARTVLSTVWDRSALLPGRTHGYAMADEMLYLYHMVHAAGHFRQGGCGMRTVLDTWLLNHRVDFDPGKRRALLQQGGLLTFARALETVAEAWFSGASPAGAEDVEAFILEGGRFGKEQRLAAAQAQNGRRAMYLLRRAFPPRSVLRYAGYPVLERRPWLLPLCWAHRLLRGLRLGKGKLIAQEVQATRAEAARSARFSALFERLELN